MSKRSPKSSTPKRGGPAGPRAGRRIAFRALAILLPLVALFLIEMICRARGFGGYPDVLVSAAKTGNREWYATNRRGTDTFFLHSGGLQTGGMRDLQFADPKPANALRVILVGESAMQGFPQIPPLTNGSFLEAMLRDVFRDRSVEVLNLGATAVASFPVVAILEEALDHAPDLVVVMTGNNEFYGAYGVASLPVLLRSPAGMKTLRTFRGLGLSQWIETRLKPKGQPAGTLMERMAKDHEVGERDPLRNAAASSLRSHIADAVRLCRARNVPVIVCTVPTNERGLAPIGSGKPAVDHFQKARELSRLGKFDDARNEYILARDRDSMPWRTTSGGREAIVAGAAGGVLCDMEAAFRAESPEGAIGWELLDDHVHMSLAGQALFARTIVQTLTSLPGPLNVSAADLTRLPDWKTYAGRLGHSTYSDYYALQHLRALFKVPFMRRNNENAYLRCEAENDTLLAAMSPADRAAVERWRDPALHGSSERPLEFVVGLSRLRENDFETAAALFAVARNSVPAISLWLMETDWHLLASRRHLGDPTETDMALLREIIDVGGLLRSRGGTENARVLRYLGLASNLAGDHATAIACLEPVARVESGSEAWEVVSALADSYARTGRINDARRILDRAAGDPGMADNARAMLETLSR